ncbi:MAG: metallophosphoesterase [SAR324 cluster bacterium]|nr:metallophosphoesterase [SAR324 cluster bacterium]
MLLNKILSILSAVFFLTGCMDETPDDIKTIEGNIPIGPYLQNLHSDSVTVIWSSLDETKGRVVVKNTEGVTFGEFNDEGITHFVRIKGLAPGTDYTYQVKEGSHRIGPLGRFKTPPLRESAGQQYSFVVLGDSGDGTKAQYKVAHQMRLQDPDFFLHVGDIVYPNGAQNHYYEKFFRPYQDLLVNKIFWLVLGNHDYQSSNGKTFDKFFDTPANNVEKNERYYSFEYGNALFIALDSGTLSNNQGQQDFLESILSQSQHIWRFVFFHHPLYSSGNKHGSSLGLRRQIGPILETYDVDMVFSGHDHHYERTSSRQDFVQDGFGTVYFVSGGGGTKLRGTGNSDFTAYSASIHHIIRIIVNDSRLDMEAIDAQGNIFDFLHLEKPH